jgi:hypothetical protein
MLNGTKHMESERHTLFGVILAAIILGAVIAGLLITGGPAEARKLKQDQLRETDISMTALALVCYHKVHGAIPDDLSLVKAEIDDSGSASRAPDRCRTAEYLPDPVTGEPFSFVRENGDVRQICAVFATRKSEEEFGYYGRLDVALSDLTKARKSAGEHCYTINFSMMLD